MKVVVPVSYTHLDVYKRQFLYRSMRKSTARESPDLLRATKSSSDNLLYITASDAKNRTS